MKQTFHKFKAETLEQAYRAMRQKLGDDAVVIRTANVTEGGILGGLFARTLVEITASAMDHELPIPQRKLSPAERKYLTAGRASQGEGPVDATPLGSDERVQETVAFFKNLVRETQQRIGVLDGPSGKTKPLTTAEPSGKPTPPIDARPGDVNPVDESPQVTYRRPVPMNRPEPDGNVVPAPNLFSTRTEAASPDQASPETMRRDLAEMKEMLNILSAEMPGAGLQPEFIQHYRMLLGRGVDRKRAASLVNAASKRGDLRAFRDPRVFLERLKLDIRRHVATTGGITLEAGKRKVVALVGGTGVGKTTNLAKLAALFAVQERARVGVITTDTYRVAATDQLKTYASIIDLDMHVVHEPHEMKAALRIFDGYDLVLIDTAGGSPYNAEQMAELRALLQAAQPDETHLLVSACTGLEDLRNVVAQFSIMGPTAIFFTKLDETQRFGPLFCLAAESGLPLSYFSTGQDVPDDIILAKANAVANRVVEGSDRRG